MKLTKQPNEIRDDYLRTIKAGLTAIGVSNPNVSQNSDYWVTATALADQISTLFNNIVVTADELMPDTATGEDLDRLLAMFGLERRQAGAAFGKIQIVTDAPTFVVTGNELQSSIGTIYQVVIGGTFANGATLDITSKDTGAKTNLPQGSILSWVSTPAATQSTVIVTQAITGGVDLEDDETARARLLSRLANPPGAGNWQQVAEIAEASDSAVQKAFIHSAANGPGTLHIAVAGYASAASKSRAIDPNKLNSTIIPTIKGQLPEYVESTITSVTDVPTDVSFSVTLPLATSSFGPATGGGWLDPTPFPSVNNSSIFYCNVTALTDTTHFTVASAAPPTPGVSRVSWIDRTTWTVKRAKVLSYTGSGPFGLVVDTPFVGLAVGDYIFPSCVNAQVYLDAVLGSVEAPSGFFLLGPGEKTTVVQRAARQPRPSSSFPSSVDASILRALINAGPEVLTASFYARSQVTPDIPASIASPPNILIPHRIGFYAPTPLA